MNTTQDWQKRYISHLKSAKWRAIREGLFELRGRKCEVCGRAAKRLEVHHLTYERMGDEIPEDLRILCYCCHIAADQHRTSATQARRQQQLQAAFRTWYRKKTGRDPAYATEDDCRDFEYWLAWKTRSGSASGQSLSASAASRRLAYAGPA